MLYTSLNLHPIPSHHHIKRIQAFITHPEDLCLSRINFKSAFRITLYAGDIPVEHIQLNDLSIKRIKSECE